MKFNFLKNRRYLIYLLFFSFFVIISINCNDREIELASVNELDFNFGGANAAKHNGVFEYNNIEYIYTANISTRKSIKIFTKEGVQKWNIPIDTIVKEGEQVDNFAIFSPDTIVVLTMYSNKLYYLNSKGVCWKKLNLNNIILSKSNDVYEYYGEDNIYFDKNAILLKCGWRSNLNDIEPKDNISNLKYFYKNVANKSLLLKIDNLFSDSINYEYCLDGFYKKISDSTHLLPEILKTYKLNNSLFCSSTYSNKIFQIDVDKLNIIKESIIHSDYSKIGFEPILFHEDIIREFQNIVTKNYLTKGIIDNLYFDKVQKLYYLTIRHQITQEQAEEFEDCRPWSLLVYDEDFKKLKEFAFKGGLYNSEDVLFCKEGILVSNNLKSRKDYDKKIARYMLFKVSK